MKKTERNLTQIDLVGIAIVALILIGTVTLCIVAPGCSDSDDNGPGADVEQCEQTADKMEECIDLSGMGTTHSEMKAECKNEGFDEYDRCLFKCSDQNTGCESLIDCWDGC